MFCYKCGTQLEENSVFCHKCGAQVLYKEAVQATSRESALHNTATQQSVDKEFNGPADNQTHSIQEDVPSKGKSKKLPILIGVTALVIIIVVSTFVIRRKADDKDYAESDDFVEMPNGNNSVLQGKVSLTESFTDQERGISFQYPAEWTILDSSGEYNIVEMLDSGNTADHIATLNIKKIFDQDPYGAYTQDKASVQENVNEYGEFLDLEDRMLGDVPAKVLKYRKEGMLSDDIVTFFWYRAGEDIYQVTCSCTASTIETYEPIFEAIMDSYTVNTAISEQSKEDIFGFESDYREAYIDKVCELSVTDGSLQFALIDLIDNGVPELVVDYSGYDVSVFTWVEEGVITLMDQWPYGAMGNMGYEYLPGQNVIRNYNMESAGAIIYESYMKVNDNYEVVSIFDEDISIRYIRDSNANGIIDEEDEYSDEPVYYCNETEISEKEYAAYQIAGDYESIKGSMSADIMLDLLRGDDEVMEDSLTDSDVLIEDYYRLSGIYSDSIGYTNLSLGIYTSQEEGEMAIGTVVLYMDDEETYLGDLIPLEEGVYKIALSTEDEMILEETKGDGIILLLYVNGEYIDAYRMIEHYES